jgi:hypothetical protein
VNAAMNNYLKKLGAAAFLLFLGLWLAGVIRTYFVTEPDNYSLLLDLASRAPRMSPLSEGFRSGTRVAHNLAQIDLSKDSLPKILDQADVNQIRVYDKTAELSTGSPDFGEDEARIRKAIATHKAIVFSESATGIAPARLLSIGIGVHPDRFDGLLQQISQVGQLVANKVQQQDRTGEFLRLHAERQSLKKHQEAIVKLLANDKLTVEEALKLEQKVLEVEKEMQPMGVKLGDFVGKEPSYNLFLTLTEIQPGSLDDRSFTIGRRLGSGFIWAIGWWFASVLGIGLIVGAVVSIKILRLSPKAAKSG